VVLRNCPTDYTHGTIVELHEAAGLSASTLESSRFDDSSQENPELCKVLLRYADAASADAAAANLNGQEVAGASGLIVTLEASTKKSSSPSEIMPSVYLSDVPVEWTIRELRDFHDECGVPNGALVTAKFLPSKDASGETTSCIARYDSQDAADTAIKVFAGKPLTTKSGVRKYVGARPAKPARWMVAKGVAAEQAERYNNSRGRYKKDKRQWDAAEAPPQQDAWTSANSKSSWGEVAVEQPPGQEEDIQRLISEREQCRRVRDYKRADEIRDMLRTAGVNVDERMRPAQEAPPTFNSAIHGTNSMQSTGRESDERGKEQSSNKMLSMATPCRAAGSSERDLGTQESQTGITTEVGVAEQTSEHSFKLHEAADPLDQAMSVKELKARLKQHGADFTGLAEKSELLALLHQVEAAKRSQAGESSSSPRLEAETGAAEESVSWTKYVDPESGHIWLYNEDTGECKWAE